MIRQILIIAFAMGLFGGTLKGGNTSQYQETKDAGQIKNIIHPGPNANRDWENLENALQHDSSYAHIDLQQENHHSHYFYAFDFNFNIPSNINLEGFEVTIHKQAESHQSNIISQELRLVYDSNFHYSDNIANNEIWPDPSASSFKTTYGGPNDTWGLDSLSASVLNDSTFGIAFVAARNGNQGSSIEGKIDLISFTFYSDDSPLPVELTVFKADAKDQKVELNWETASEQNSSHFIVERSNNKKEFSTIGKVDAAGHSQSTQKYSFKDHHPEEGENYYRLKKVDNDDSFERSRWVHAAFKKPVKNPESPTFYPNPLNSGQKFKFSYSSDSDKVGEISILNLQGDRVFNFEIDLNKNRTEYDLPVPELPEGIYILRKVTDNKPAHVERIQIR